jgi:rfaE bifunctional protein kinase chain/domain
VFNDKKILIIGDVMLDSYFFGKVDRISPEAPVPIVDILSNKDKLGGAANVAKNIKKLGGTPILCSIVGDDLKGNNFISLLDKLNINSEYVYKSKDRITTVKSRIIGNNRQMLRIDEELNIELKEKDKKNILNNILNIIDKNNIDSILFQDYDKGLLDKEIIKKTIEIANKKNIPILVDPKKRNFFNYKNVTLFKPNFKEFKEGLKLEADSKIKMLEYGSEILHDNGIKIVFVTLSENGIFISYKKKNKIINKIIPGTSREVVDVSGAGDTVISVTSMLLNDLDIEEIAKISNLAGGLVCEEIGVASINKKRLIKEYKKINKTDE